MEYGVIAVASLCASLLTLFSGFGLGTILMPVFALFFPVEMAVAMTGVVHFSNNFFKVGLLGKFAHWRVVLSFGVPSMVGAFIGAHLLISLAEVAPLTHYMLGGVMFFIQPVKLVIALMMIVFVLIEVIPGVQNYRPSGKSMTAGGLVSGFFGGLSGHQGALRTMFLVRYGLAKEQFLATGIMIACIVDITRLSLYSTRLLHSEAIRHWEILLVAVCSAFLGAYIGNILLKKITLGIVQRIVSIMLIAIAILLAAGVL